MQKCHVGWYNGEWIDSSWELAFMLYCEDKGIKIERNLTMFPYRWRNRIHYYVPDFKDKDGYIEIKGRMTQKSKVKIASFKGNLRVLRKADMVPILNYAIKKYGRDFTRFLKYTRKGSFRK